MKEMLIFVAMINVASDLKPPEIIKSSSNASIHHVADIFMNEYCTHLNMKVV